MKLAIISHTEHYKNEDGFIVGLAATVNEINHLLEIFDEIFHIAMLYDKKTPSNVLPYKSGKVTFIPLNPIGGKTLFDKLKIIWNTPQIIRTVSKTLKQVDYFQMRIPTGIGVFLIPYLTFFAKTKGWFKYAGNWNQKHPPISYGLQRLMLKRQSRKITINGHWLTQPKHCITFENPCLTVDEVSEASGVALKKKITGQITICFVGRLEHEKGVGLILEVLSLLNKAEKQRIVNVHLVGDGKDRLHFKSMAARYNVPVIFHGILARHDVFEVYKQSHVLLLPSKSEGFPKVIAEAMAFGCIPIVSDVSSIGQYIQHEKLGYLLMPITANEILKQLQKVLKLIDKDYYEILKSQKLILKRFTYSYYNDRIKSEILNT